jgi:hypothetical protein
LVNNNTQNDTQIVLVEEKGELEAPSETQHKPQFCPRCGKVGHVANLCPSPVICSRCHKKGHVATVCMTKMPWEFISPFCGLSTCGQGFHVIESASTEEGAKDMSTTALITVKQMLDKLIEK